MITPVEAVFRDGRIELLPPAPAHAESCRMVATFLPPEATDELTAEHIESLLAARFRFVTIAADRDSPKMDIYDE